MKKKQAFKLNSEKRLSNEQRLCSIIRQIVLRNSMYIVSYFEHVLVNLIVIGCSGAIRGTEGKRCTNTSQEEAAKSTEKTG